MTKTTKEMKLNFKLIWIFVFITAMISTVNCGGNSFVPAPTIPDEPMLMPSIPVIGRIVQDTSSDPTNPQYAPKCQYVEKDQLQSKFYY